jgi:hypothetical protein
MVELPDTCGVLTISRVAICICIWKAALAAVWEVPQVSAPLLQLCTSELGEGSATTGNPLQVGDNGMQP